MSSITKICGVERCVRSAWSRGLCNMHYKRWHTHGNPTMIADRYHGLSKTPEYQAWSDMKTRCYALNFRGRKNYGGRGIKVCDRWRNSFLAFYDDMGKRPSTKHSIDRKNVNGDYEPNNCRWATKVTQSLNQRTREMNTSGYRGVSFSKNAKKMGNLYYLCWEEILFWPI